MGVTINGNNITITNATIEVVNGVNEETGVAYIIITPDGGVGSLPFLAQGLPGQPTLFPSISVVQLNIGDPEPVPNPTVTLIDQGGPGLPASYALTFYIYKGQTGSAGSPSIAGASDLAATPVLGAGTEKFFLAYRNSDLKWVPTAQKVGDQYVSATISSTAFNNTSPRLLHSIAIPAQPFDYRLRAFVQTVVTGSSDTRIDLHVRLNDAAAGDQIGYAKGFTGLNPQGFPTVLIPAPIAATAVPGSYGKVLATNACTVHLRAEQKAASSLSWSTPASPDTTFVVEVQPLL